MKFCIDLFEGNEKVWYSSTNIIILIKDSDKKSYATRKSKGKQKAVDSNCVEIKTRKPRQANWVNSEVLALINAKKTKHETSLEVDFDSKDNMETTITKWKHISKVVMANSHSHHHHNEPTYKDKWGSFYGDYNKIHDYQNVICHNEEYWNMSMKNKVSQGLSKNCSKVFFELIDIFMNSRPCFKPPTFKRFHESKWWCLPCNIFSWFFTMWKIGV